MLGRDCGSPVCSRCLPPTERPPASSRCPEAASSNSRRLLARCHRATLYVKGIGRTRGPSLLMERGDMRVPVSRKPPLQHEGTVVAGSHMPSDCRMEAPDLRGCHRLPDTWCPPQRANFSPRDALKCQGFATWPEGQLPPIEENACRKLEPQGTWRLVNGESPGPPLPRPDDLVEVCQGHRRHNIHQEGECQSKTEGLLSSRLPIQYATSPPTAPELREEGTPDASVEQHSEKLGRTASGPL